MKLKRINIFTNEIRLYTYTVILTVTSFTCLFRGLFHWMFIASLIFNLNVVPHYLCLYTYHILEQYRLSVYMEPVISPTIIQKNIDTNDKFRGKIAFLRYTESVNFRPLS